VQIYIVGGAVRDKILQLEIVDHDYVVVAATVEEMIELGYTPVGKDFPVFLHPNTHEEYALARTERKTAKGYHGFAFYTSPQITLEEDLLRRDLTINAIAEDENGQLIDPYHGLDDIKDRILRHVSPAFAEDPVRILRVARFAARFANLGFRVAPETNQLMRDMVNSGEVDALVAERVWQEVERALAEKHPEVFFQVLRDCGALQRLFPEIDNLFGVPQPEKWHPEIDCGLHTMMVLQQAAKLSDNIAVRFAALVHDLGKGITPKDELPSHKQHEARGLPLVKNVCQRLKVPKQVKELALAVTEYHLHFHKIGEMKNTTIIKFFTHIDAFRRPERYQLFLLACEADSRGRGGYEDKKPEQVALCKDYFAAAQAVAVGDIVKAGYKGPEIAEQLYQERVKALREFKSRIIER